jgi:putative ABC transport system permease protein
MVIRHYRRSGCIGMNFSESIRVALRALRVNKMRSMLTVLGIIVGVAAVVCMVSVSAGAQAQVSDKIRTLGANLLLVTPGAQSNAGVRLEAGTRHTLTEEDATAIRRNIGAVQVAAPVLSRTTQVIAGNRNWATLVAGINPDYLVAREWPIREGRSFNTDELGSGAKVAMIGDVIAEQLFAGQVPLGQTVRIGNVPFTVVGVLDRKGQGAMGRNQDDVVFIPLSSAKSRVLGAVRGNSRDALDFIVVKVTDPEALADVQKEVAATLRQRHQLRKDAADDFNIENPADVLSAREGAVRTFGFLLIAIASVSLMVGGISIMNIMLVSVTERTREIGLRMAVGARRRDIRRQFLIEAVTLAIVGGVIGAVVGSAAAGVIAWQAQWPVLISPWGIVLACGFSAFVGVAFGLYPAYRASRLDPMIALRYE